MRDVITLFEIVVTLV